MKYYFETKDCELCYTIGYFESLMEENGVQEMTVYEAKKYQEEGVFWCKGFGFVGETGDCGSLCVRYSPRNGKSGCCRHYSKAFFEPGKEIIIHRGSSRTKHKQ